MADAEAHQRTDRSLSQLTRDLSQDVSELVRSELALAKTEVAAKAAEAARGGALVVAAAVFGLIVVECLVAAAIAALALAVDVWLAALIVAAVAVVVAVTLGALGRRSLRKARPPLPTETVESVKEDIAWVEAQAKRGAR
jgi:Flp pilus assembly protein TadB